MNHELIVASLSLALWVAVVVLIRQVRLRRALEMLLRRLLLRWRNPRDE